MITFVGSIFVVLFYLQSTSLNAQLMPKIIGTKWETTQTKHFTIHYHEGTEGTVQDLVSFADDVFEKVTSIYKYTFDKKVHIVMVDYRDGTNGFAISSMNVINLEATPLYFSDFNLRGRSDWLRNVLTHEFAHIVSLKNTERMGARVSTYNFSPISNQIIDDIGGKNPNLSIFTALPFPSRINPYWWVEGIAQHDTELIGHDSWDTHRDMFLRMAALEDNMLTLQQMSVKPALKSPYGELGYCQGFSFSNYLSGIAGRDMHDRLSRLQGDRYYLTWDAAMEELLGKPADIVYADWKASIEERYKTVALSLKDEHVAGTLMEFKSQQTTNDEDSDELDVEIEDDDTPKDRDKVIYDIGDVLTDEKGHVIKRRTRDEKDTLKRGGKYHVAIKVSPDGNWISLIKDSVLYVYKKETKKEHFKLSGISSYDWSPDSRELVVSQVDKKGALFQRGFEYHILSIVSFEPYIAYNEDPPKPKFKNITDAKLRAEEPSWSPDGNNIAFISNGDGKKRLGVLMIDRGEIRFPFPKNAPGQMASPDFGPDSKSIVFVWFKTIKQNLWTVQIDGSNLIPLTDNQSDDRDPHWISEESIIFSSDRNGIYNIFALNPKTRNVDKISNVLGGAFMPFWDKEQIYYTQFSSFGFKPYQLPMAQSYSVVFSQPKRNQAVVENFEVSKKNIPTDLKSESYHHFGFIPKWSNWIPLQLIPEIWLFETQVDLGLTMILEDLVSHHRLMGRFLLGEDQTYSAEYVNNSWYPSFHIKYAKVKNKFFLSELYGVEFLTSQNIPEESNPGLYAEFNQDIVSAGARYFMNKRTTSGFRFGVDYQYRKLAIKVSAEGLGAHVKDKFLPLRSNCPAGFDCNGPSWGDETKFTMLTNNGVNFMVAQLKGASILSETVYSKGDTDINPRGWAWSANISLTHSFIDSRLENLGIFGSSIDGEPTQSYLYEVFRLDGVYHFSSPLNKSHGISLQGSVGYIPQNVVPNDQLYLGGKSLFTTFRDVNNSFNFPGYASFSVSGETRMVASAMYRLPLLHDYGKGSGPYFLDEMFLNFFTDIGNAWDKGNLFNTKKTFNDDDTLKSERPAILADVGVTFAVKSFLFYLFPWHFFTTVAYGFSDNAGSGFVSGDFPVRIYMGLGGGF